MAMLTVMASLLAAMAFGADLSIPVESPPISAVVGVPDSSQPRRPPRLIEKVSVSDILSKQKLATVPVRVGEETIEMALGFGPKETPVWLKFQQAGHMREYPLSRFKTGADVSLPLRRYHVTVKGDLISIVPIHMHEGRYQRESDGEVHLSVLSLLESLYAQARHAQIDVLDFAVLDEMGSQIPDSVTLLRKNEKGRVQVTYAGSEELAKIDWFVSIDGTWIGMRLEQGALAFYARSSTLHGFRRFRGRPVTP